MLCMEQCLGVELSFAARIVVPTRKSFLPISAQGRESSGTFFVSAVSQLSNSQPLSPLLLGCVINTRALAPISR